jgi:hypothetical protein
MHRVESEFSDTGRNPLAYPCDPDLPSTPFPPNLWSRLLKRSLTLNDFSSLTGKKIMSRNARDSCDKEHLLSGPPCSGDAEECSHRAEQGPSTTLRCSLMLNFVFAGLLLLLLAIVPRGKDESSRPPGEVYCMSYPRTCPANRVAYLLL